MPRTVSRTVHVVVLAAGVLLAGACSTPRALPDPVPQPRLLRAGDVDTMPVRTAGLRIRYGDDSLQFGDLRLPQPGRRAPLVIVIHGGCWYSPYASLRNTAPLAQALTDAGYATWNVEYRRYDHPGGGWPGTFHDVARAADHVRALARDHPIDSMRVVAIGHSAGGHLALWLASRLTLSQSSDLYTGPPMALAGVVSIGGVADLREFYTRQLNTCGNPAVESLLGGAPDSVAGRLRDASPIERLPLGIRSIHVAGERDMIAPASVLEAYAARARAANDVVEIVRIPNEGHFEAIAPGRVSANAVLDAVRRLLVLRE